MMEVFWIAAAIAVVTWTQTKEEITREFRSWLQRQSQTGPNFLVRKLSYMFTCEFCFSFWVSLAALLVFRHRVAFEDWRGVVLAQLGTWAIANVYMTGYSMFRVDIRKDQIEIKKEEAKVKNAPADGRVGATAPLQ